MKSKEKGRCKYSAYPQPIEEIAEGQIIYIKAIVEKKEIHSWHTKVWVKSFTNYAVSEWKAIVNSVDVYTLLTNRTGGEG